MQLDVLRRALEQLEESINDLVLADSLVAEEENVLAEKFEISCHVAHESCLLRVAVQEGE